MNPSGHGLGLFISRKICLALGGDLTVESKAGFGSTFVMTVAIKWINPNEIKKKD